MTRNAVECIWPSAIKYQNLDHTTAHKFEMTVDIYVVLLGKRCMLHYRAIFTDLLLDLATSAVILQMINTKSMCL